MKFGRLSKWFRRRSRLSSFNGHHNFERDVQYHFGPPMISAKAMFLRRRMERESREALFRAKQILEKS
jgi:hypothetical protein